MEEYVRLSAAERVPARPFTDPERSREDLTALRVMVAILREHLAASPLPESPRPLVRETREADGRPHRAIICRDAPLRARADLEFVGFFARRRPGLDFSPLTRADDELILEFPAHPGILSYSSLELPDGNWGNLIVLDRPEARDRWREGARHAYAAQELAPRYYSVVRLHHGRLPGGLLSGRDPVLTRTKYYDFGGPMPWRADRDLSGG